MNRSQFVKCAVLPMALSLSWTRELSLHVEGNFIPPFRPLSVAVVVVYVVVVVVFAVVVVVFVFVLPLYLVASS